jgi:hypothetical protein
MHSSPQAEDRAAKDGVASGGTDNARRRVIKTLADGRRVAEALISISGSVRNTATLLEVLVATKIASLTGLDPANV